MSILDYIEKIKRENEGPRIVDQEPRNMELAKAGIPRHLWTNMNTPDLEQSPDSFLRPGETLENWDTSFRRPNAQGGRIKYDEGSSYEYKIQQIMDKHPGMTRPLAIKVIEAGISPDDYDAIAGLESKADGGRIGFVGGGADAKFQTWDSIAEALQKADIADDLDYLMTTPKEQKKVHKGKVRYKKGMMTQTMMQSLNKLQTNEEGLKYIANKLGENSEWVLDKIDERVEHVKESRLQTMKAGDPTHIKHLKVKKDYAKAEKWLNANGSKYSDPDKFKKAFIKRFGKNNAFISNIGQPTFFSNNFNIEMLGGKSENKLSKGLIDNIFRSTIYTFNPKVRDEIVKTLTDFEGMKPFRSRGAVKDWMNSQKILVKYGLNERIDGPISRLIQKKLGDTVYKNIQTLRFPYNSVVDMLDYYASKASPKYKKTFIETSEALKAANAGDFKKAKDKLIKADKMNWDHKVPSSFIDAGYADEINRAKVVPTTKYFNIEIKAREFDGPMMKLFNKYKNAAPFEKKGIYEEILNKKEEFSRKYGRYMDDVYIKPDKSGVLKMSSTADVVTKKTDLTKMLKTSLEQEKGKVPKEFKTYLKNSRNKTAAEAQAKLFQKLGIDAPCSNLVAGGGRIGFATKTCGLELARRKPGLFLELAADEKYQKIIQGMDPNKVKSAGRVILKNMRKLGYANPFSWIGGEIWYTGLDAWASKTKGTPLLESLDNAFIFYNFDRGRKNFEKVAEDMGYSDLQMDALRETINLAQTGQEQEKQERVLGNLESTQQEYMQPHPSYRDPDKPILPPGMEAMAVKKTGEQISSQQKVLQDLEEKSTLGWTNLLKNISKQKGLDPEMYWHDLKEEDLDQTFADIYKTAETMKRKELQSLGEEKYTEKGEQFDPYASPFGSWVYSLFGDKDKEKNYLTWDQLQDQNVSLPEEAMQELYGRGWFGKNIYKDLGYLFGGADGGRAGYMGGGIAAIRKPSAIAPTGGPQSGGLPSLYNNVRKL